MILDRQELAHLKIFLDSEVEKINSVDFIEHDPVQFPRRFSALRDIEIVALLSATIAWGNRKMICNNCEKLLTIMGNEPQEFLLEQAYEVLPDELNVHRTFFVRNLKYMMRGLNRIYSKFDSLNDFAAAHHVSDCELPAWRLVELMQHEMRQANNGSNDSRCLPTNLNNTALKRVNMALRWLVRDDGIVDMGVWNAIKPSQLFIPLDVHVGDTARSLRMIERRANDKKTVIELTSLLRHFNPEDPVIYDYALFGIGINSKEVAS